MNFIYAALVVSAWASNPLFRRAFVDRLGNAADGSATYVLWNSVACSLLAVVSAWIKSTKIAPLTADPSLLGLIVGTSTMGVMSTYLMNVMMAKNNPGYVICVVSGTNNIVVYLLGSMFYGRLDATGVLGAALVGAGIALITYAKEARVAV